VVLFLRVLVPFGMTSDGDKKSGECIVAAWMLNNVELYMYTTMPITVVDRVFIIPDLVI
jgi:hypothetical protein